MTIDNHHYNDFIMPKNRDISVFGHNNTLYAGVLRIVPNLITMILSSMNAEEAHEFIRGRMSLNQRCKSLKHKI